MINQYYTEMRRQINDFLSYEYTPNELIKIKDRVRGLFLKGLISDYECNNLLELLPTLTELSEEDIMDIEDEQEVSEEDEETNTFANAGENIQFYETIEDDEPDQPQKKKGSFEVEDPVLKYTSDYDIDDEDEPPEANPKHDTSGFLSTSSDSLYSDIFGDDDDEEDYIPEEKKPSSGFFGSSNPYEK